MFHHSVAHLIFMSLLSRRYIQTLVSLLTTRVKSPDEDDRVKLKIILKYLKGTKHTNLTLILESLLVVNWWIDVSYNTHDYCKGHRVKKDPKCGGSSQFVSETEAKRE